MKTDESLRYANEKHSKILGLTMVGALIGVNCSAYVSAVKEEQTNWNIVYPKVVIYNNRNSEYPTNENIQQYYSKMRIAFQQMCQHC